MPCQAPPWGRLVGASQQDGKTIWQRRNGTTRDSFPVVPLLLKVGVPALGGPTVVIAAGGHGSFGTKIGDSVVAYALPQ